MPGYLNRRRAALLMQDQGLDALVLTQPETITYATGALPGVASFWRRAGAAIVLVPADETMPLAAIVGDLQAASFQSQSRIADVRTHRLWVETDQFPNLNTGPKRQPRPAQYDLPAVVQMLGDLLRERGLSNARVGLELGFVPAADFPAFQKLGATWFDCTRIVERLRAIKHPDEIVRLRTAAELASAGVTHVMQAIAPGMTAFEMTAIWKDHVNTEAARRAVPPPQSTWAYIAVGGDGFAPGGPAQAGDMIKIDVGCVIDGYSSDGGRTACLGAPSSAARKFFDALHRAFDLGLARLAPGIPLREVYRTTSEAMWAQGYDTYNRGHFGHGVGSSIWSEEWPFIASEAEAIAEPGMVLAFETPHYVNGLGGFIIEDQLLVTESGIEVMASTPRGLRIL